ncbi:MAG TPA: helix-turn-helix domain-containing protein [Gemmatimonadales bacterium]|nr:helix-turn-helix domain-containing protein [Gemmatimonadales bacterium]
MGAPLPLTDDMPMGHRGQRGHVLTQLKRAQPLTARELALKLGVSLNAARHHLKELEAEGLVSYSREHRGVGAPVFTYRLSHAGEELFPRRYGDALTAMLGTVVEREGRGAAVGLLESYFAALAGRMRTRLTGVPRSERLAIVARLLSEEGYMAEAGPAEPSQGEGSSGGRVAVLTEHNCAIPAVAERFPEICAAEARFLAEVLGAEVERTEHILSGCPACAYRVRFGGGAEESS